MSQEQLHESDQVARRGAVLFIDQHPEAFQRDNIRAIASHARRWQTARKHKERRAEAHREALYARGLVGWQTTGPNVSSQDGERAGSLYFVKARQGHDNEDEGMQLEKISFQVSGGLRTDPFDSLPSPGSRSVMHMVDYYIHVWSPHKAGKFDAYIGSNTQLHLCWPYALQDDMLFNASIAVSRVAWCLMHEITPSNDHMMLHHRGIAMSKMRDRISSQAQGADVELIFTIGRMLSIAYMSNEPAPFDAHLKAFQKVAKPFIDSQPDSDIAAVVENRLKSWLALQSFRSGYNPLESRDSQVQDSEDPSQQPKLDLTSENCGDADLSVGLDRLEFSTSLCPAVIGVLKSLIRLTSNLTVRRDDQDRNLPLVESLTKYCQCLDRILAHPGLPKLDFQFCCGLFAFCLQLRQLLDDEGRPSDKRSHHSEADKTSHTRDSGIAMPSLSHLNNIAQAFINQKLADVSRFPHHKSCIAWSALMLGNYLAHSQDNGLRTKGHIILISIRETVMQFCPLHNQNFGWEGLKAELADSMDSLWVEELQGKWEQSWHRTMTRQRVWEEQGLLKIGAPVADEKSGDGKVDVVEYLVLREARDSLPRVEEPQGED